MDTPTSSESELGVSIVVRRQDEFRNNLLSVMDVEYQRSNAVELNEAAFTEIYVLIKIIYT